MDVKEAVAKAKTYVSDLFQSEQIRNLGLEEVEFDEKDSAWYVTIGFSRPWEQAGFVAQAGLSHPRALKVVRISNDGTVTYMKERRRVAA